MINSYAFLIKCASMFEIFFCIFFYTLPFRRRQRFYLRTLMCILCSVAVLIPLSGVYAAFPGVSVNIFITFCFYVLAFASMTFIYRESAAERLLAICAGIATQTVVGRIYEFIYLMLGMDPYNSFSFFPEAALPQWLDWGVYYIFHFILIFLLSLLFRRKKIYSHTGRSTRMIVIFSVVITAVTVPISSYSRPLEVQDSRLALVIRVLSILYGFMVLFAQKGILEQERISEELRITGELLYAEKKQYENIRSDMDAINTMCHDLRHQLNQYSGKLTEKELDELKSAISIYDTSIKTGNEILDVILYKKQTYFIQNQIQFSCIADGSCLSFLTASHTYSLFNNALENAVDAVMELEDPQMRIISLTVSNVKGIVEIHMTNYCKKSPVIRDGIPQTTKPDAGHHGFGVKSMQYIVEQYNGTISFAVENNMFYLNIFFPPER